MALTFTTTSPSGASVAAVAALVQSAWRDALTGHASGAWTLVEEFDSTSATVHWVVLKNSTSVSGVGIDFYVAIGRRASDGEMRIAVGEGYTTSGHILSTYAARFTSTPPAINANGTYTTTSFSLGTTLPGIGGTTGDPNTGYTGSLVPGASTVKVSTYVTEKMAILTHYIASGNKMTFANAVGNFGDTLIVPPSVDPVLVGFCDLLNNGAMGALTRHPVEAADSTMKYPQQIWSPEVNAAFIQCGMNQLAVRCGNYYGGDRFQAGRVAACEVAIVMYAPFQNAAASTPASQSGVLRGKFRGLKYGGFADVGVPGDTVVVDGHKHMLIGKVGQGGQIAANQSAPFLGLMMDTGA